MFRLAVQKRIGLPQECVGCRIGLNVRPMVDEVPDWNTAGDFCHTAKVIQVPVGRDQVIDLAQAGILYCSHDASSVACRRVQIPCIDENRFPGRSYQQFGATTFDIDDINIQCLRCLAHGY